MSASGLPRTASTTARPGSAHPLSSVLGVDPRAQLISLVHSSHDVRSGAMSVEALGPAAEASPLRAADARRTVAAIRARTASSPSRVTDPAEQRRKMLHVPPPAVEPQRLRSLSSGKLHSLNDFDCGPPLPRNQHHSPMASSTSRPEEELSAGSVRLSARGSVLTKLRGKLKDEWAQSWHPAAAVKADVCSLSLTAAATALVRCSAFEHACVPPTPACRLRVRLC
jgi:hypothetical protein